MQVLHSELEANLLLMTVALPGPAFKFSGTRRARGDRRPCQVEFVARRGPGRGARGRAVEHPSYRLQSTITVIRQ